MNIGDMKQPPISKWMRRLILPVIILALTFLTIHLMSRKRHYTLSLTTCLKNAQNIHPKTQVAIAGVYVGAVSNVRLQPQEAMCPASVEMVLVTDEELKIPKDSLIEKDTDGILGPTYLEIDTTHASGPFAHNNDRLASSEPPQMTLDDMARAVKQIPGMVEAVQSFEATQKKLDSQEGKTLPAKGIRPKPKTGK